jgi:7,8-dihydropterin-6-yl-methyl-4-(beta-D-ribofuranosyl)aminobenzene 5'-phosphate synthase
MMSKVNLREADRLEITIMVDNYSDLILGNTEVVKRVVVSMSNVPLAEHGLSCLIKVIKGSEEHFVMLDAGITPISIIHNLNILGVDMGQIETLILSHGHLDHYGGIMALLDRARDGIPIILHPHALLERRINRPGTEPPEGRSLNESLLKDKGTVVQKIKEPSLLASDLVLITGEVERITDFEKGFAWAEAKIDGEWKRDPFYDDQGLAVNLKDKGLVVLGGCSHAGIINTVRYAQKVTGINKVYAVMGGFHLNGPLFEPIIGPTIEEMKKIGPDIIVPMHCTGWNAINAFAQAMPNEFFLNAVGSTYLFQ